jgi:hypothetical protein
MSLQAEYRSQAAECMAAARASERRNSKALFLMLADAWVRLADQLEERAQKAITLTETL